MTGTGPLQLSFVMSAPGVDALPRTTAEVAVMGRSNVGKSSLINAMANRTHLAQVSKTPGRTRLLNLYEVNGGGSLVDLPGYGYAAVSKATKSAWPKMIETYLLSRDGLVMVMVLVDGEIGPTPLDLKMLAWLRHHGIAHSIVATKYDKVKPSQRFRREKELAAGCALEPGDIFWVSAAKGTGISALRGRVHSWLSA
ncbi:MAG TPA: ribosome biogenesis GTP-binding protein YihA/YsxC [Acidimicrobiales bacterium]|nr:ribosome biogenesis GTP-binding protein YihA/YsxC [Acidimicrobiales bacterium]